MPIAPVGATLGGAGCSSPALIRVTTVATVEGGRASRFIRAVPGRATLRKGAESTTGGTTLARTLAATVTLLAITRLWTGAVSRNARSLARDAMWRPCHEIMAACAI